MLTRLGPVLGSPDEDEGAVAERVALNYVRDVTKRHADADDEDA